MNGSFDSYTTVTIGLKVPDGNSTYFNIELMVDSEMIGSFLLGFKNLKFQQCTKDGNLTLPLFFLR